MRYFFQYRYSIKVKYQCKTNYIHIQTDKLLKRFWFKNKDTLTHPKTCLMEAIWEENLASPVSPVTSRCHHRFLLSVWKHRLDACTVWRVPVSKHVDTACVYQYRPHSWFLVPACLDWPLTISHFRLLFCVFCAMHNIKRRLNSLPPQYNDGDNNNGDQRIMWVKQVVYHTMS